MIDFKLYLITDRKTTGGDYYKSIEDALRGGVRAVQLREKDLPLRDVLMRAYELRRITYKYKARLFINDRVDIALAVDAEGVHLGGNSLPVHAARKAARGRLLIGVSTHGLQEALKAESEGADFITFGPVYETPSKLKYGPPQGLKRLREIVENIKIPVFAIGGVNENNLMDVMNTGSFGVAMISAILSSDNIKEKTERIVRLLK